MTFAQLDNRFHDHPKVLALLEHDDGLAAIGLWTLVLTWCHSHADPYRPEEAGLIPASLPRRLGGSSELAQLLVGVGLWDATIDGWLIHDFGERQDLVGWQRRTDKARRAVQTRWSNRTPSITPSITACDTRSNTQHNTEQDSKEDRIWAGFTPDGDETIIHEPQTGNIPSSGSKPPIRTTPAGKPLTRIPVGFTVDEKMVAFARQRRPDVDWRTETDRFIAHWNAKPGQDGEKADWPRAWRNWISRARSRPGYGVNGNRQRGNAENWG